MIRATRCVRLFLLLALPSFASAQQYNGLMGGLDNLYRLSNAKLYSISPENLTGGKGRGAMAGEEGSAWLAAGGRSIPTSACNLARRSRSARSRARETSSTSG